MRLQQRNILASLMLHVITIMCGLILPREILSHYGSEMNGLLHALSRFLSYTILLDFGVGAVIPSSLYKPLAENDQKKVSAIIASGNKTYHRIGLVGIVYVIILAVFLPVITGTAIPMTVSLPLLLCLAFGSLTYYFAGTPERQLLIADQKGYVVYCISAGAVIISTLLQTLLIRSGSSLSVAKLAASFVTTLQVIVICFYVHFNYVIDRKIRNEEEVLPQKWDGAAQHIAYFVLENVDVFLLTFFVSFQEISVYSIYFMVISGVRGVFSSVCSNIQPRLGELYAKGSQTELNLFFRKFECCIHLGTVLVYTCLGLLLVPFVQAYTDGIHDADYIRPLFASLLCVAYGIQSLRDPYDKLILAVGHYSQTRSNYMVAACLNAGLSLVGVMLWGVEGVVLGTLAAMVYQLVYMAVYDSRLLSDRLLSHFVKLLLMDAALTGVILLIASCIHFPATDVFKMVLDIFHC